MKISYWIIIILVAILAFIGIGVYLSGKITIDDILAIMGKAPIVRTTKDTTDIKYDIQPAHKDILTNVEPIIVYRDRIIYRVRYLPYDSTKTEGKDSVDVRDSVFCSRAYVAKTEISLPEGDSLEVHYLYPENIFSYISHYKPADTTAKYYPKVETSVLVPQYIAKDRPWYELPIAVALAVAAYFAGEKVGASK